MAANTSSSSSTAAPKANNWCTSQVSRSFVWSIDNFSRCILTVGEFLKSPEFSVDPNCERQQQIKWFLTLYPRGERAESNGYVALFLHLSDKSPSPVSATFKFAILDVQSEQSHHCRGVPEAHTFAGNQKGWGYSHVVRVDSLRREALLPGGRLSIRCEVSVVLDDTVNVAAIQSPVPAFRLSDDMGALLERSSFADCVLCADDREFQVHKAVLACRSPVFAAMFEHETEEKRTSRVNIPDISAPVLGQLLHFVYTGCEPKLLAEQDMAGELLAAADKYQLDRLKALCEQQLTKALNKENVCDVLVLADRHNAQQLGKQAIEYINSHLDKVREREGWRTMLAHPVLLQRVLQSRREPKVYRPVGEEKKPKLKRRRSLE